MSDTFHTMATWLGAFMRGSASRGSEGRRSDALARRIIGKDGLEALRAFFEGDPEELERERVAAIQACIWVAQADRQIADAETKMLEELIANSELPWSAQKKLIASMRAELEIDEVAGRLSQPQLRELIFGMAFRLAWADGRFDAHEREALKRLGEAFGIDEDRELLIERALKTEG